MSFIAWKNVQDDVPVLNWDIVSDSVFQANLPHVQQWVIKHLPLIDEQAKPAFKAFYFPAGEQRFTPHQYTLKTYAEHSYLALYRAEK
ncbi:MAG: hypothetical protein WC196_04455 [Bacilli bacterium]